MGKCPPPYAYIPALAYVGEHTLSLRWSCENLEWEWQYEDGTPYGLDPRGFDTEMEGVSYALQRGWKVER